MVKILLAKVVTRVNFFPNKQSIPNYSPRAMLKKSKINYNQHCAIPFGTYVRAPHEANPYNTMAPRALDCIYMHPLYTAHGGHEFYHIPTGKLITQHGKVTPIPLPQHVIDSINAKGDKQGMKDLKIHSKWLPIVNAKVDNTQDEDNEEEDDSDDSDTDSDDSDDMDSTDSESDSDSEEEDEEDDIEEDIAE